MLAGHQEWQPTGKTHILESAENVFADISGALL